METSTSFGHISRKRHKKSRPRVGVASLVTAASMFMVPSSIAALVIKPQAFRSASFSRQVTLFSSSETHSLIEATNCHVSPPPVSQLFDVTLPEGRCVCLTFTDPVESLTSALNNSSIIQNRWLHDNLHNDEIYFASNMQGAPSNRLSFVLGRLAMRTLLEGEGSEFPILKDAHGRPTLLDGFLGSISHKKATAAALVTRTSDKYKMGVGVDLEYAVESKVNIAPKVLTREEMETLGNVQVRSGCVIVWIAGAMLMRASSAFRAFLPPKKFCSDSL